MRGLACIALLFAFSFTLGYGIHESNFGRGLKARASAGSSALSESNAGGSASANSQATSRDGRAFSTAIASTKSITKVENSIAKFFGAINVKQFPKYADASDKKDYCEDAYAYIDKELQAVGKVAAKVYSEAIGEVIVEGDGEACADAKSRGEAEAVGFAEIIVDAYVKVTNGYSNAKARAIVQQKNTFFVSAFAKAYASACINGDGDAFAVQTVSAEAIAEPIATLVVFLFAEVDCTGEEGYAESFVDAENTAKKSVDVDAVSDTSVNGDGTAAANGDGDAFSEKTTDPGFPKCTGIKNFCCRGKNKNKGDCKCTFSFRSSRCNGFKNYEYIGFTVWEFDDETCQC